MNLIWKMSPSEKCLNTTGWKTSYSYLWRFVSDLRRRFPLRLQENNIVPRVFVPLVQRSENESSGSNHFEITKEITEFCPSGSLRSLHQWRMPEMVASRALVSDRWSRGTKTLGTRLARKKNAILGSTSIRV